MLELCRNSTGTLRCGASDELNFSRLCRNGDAGSVTRPHNHPSNTNLSETDRRSTNTG
jgi:hypothetical protein